MKDENAKAGTDRRSFLKFAGLGGIAGGASLLTGKEAKAEEAASSASTYRETDHVKAFYDSARF